ncbi:MAG: hypothetical protein KDD53_02750, partial [Bdellovibrionales bacterium]|nr:hypothetical protein [Bdellovibrionales bacterium]
RIRVGEGGLDRGRIRTLSQSFGDIDRSRWVDVVLLVAAVLIGLGVGFAMLKIHSPDFFSNRSPAAEDYDIKIFDSDYQP